MEVIMRIRRTVLAPAMVTIGTVGALVVGPVLSLTTAATAITAATTASATPNGVIMHG
jgi:hypothetical protein